MAKTLAVAAYVTFPERAEIYTALRQDFATVSDGARKILLAYSRAQVVREVVDFWIREQGQV